MHTPTSPSIPVTLVGRERELGVLDRHLNAAMSGHGSLVLIGGEAGIGKTALAETICREAEQQGALVLVGRCYDLTETPPYGPWAELFGRWRRVDGRPPLPDAFARPGAIGEVTGRVALFQQVFDFFTALVASRPLVLLLDDLHWADPASLDLLRFLARDLSALPILLIVTYRADELTRQHPLYQLLPVLERETHAMRLDLKRLSPEAIRAFIAARYRLAVADATRLVAYLDGRAEGNAFFMTQLLRALEEEQILRCSPAGWAVGSLDGVGVPVPLRQVIDSRIARLGEEAHALLAVASVIGQEVPLRIWTAVTDSDEETLSAAVEQAMAAHLLEESVEGSGVRFVHALVRATLYEGMAVTRRHVWHRRIAEALMAVPHADPDAVAYHFRQAGDPRATEWLIAAGERAERSYAWRTAADRYEVATALLHASGAEQRRRGWLFYRVGWLRRFADLHAGIAALVEARRLAMEADDAPLAAHATHALGTLHCRTYAFRVGLSELEQSLAVLAGLSDDERRKIRAYVPIDVAFDTDAATSSFVLWLAFAGRSREACAIGERAVAGANASGHPSEGKSARRLGTTQYGLGIAYATLGQPIEARAAFAQALVGPPSNNPVGNANAVISDLEWVVLPYQTDRLAERAALATHIEELFAQASGALSEAQPRGLAHLSLWVLEGRWDEAYALAMQGYTLKGNPNSRLIAMRALGALLYQRGESERAWALVRDWLPAGPITEPGDTYFLDSLLMQRLAARLAIDGGDLPTARTWLEAHDRWLAWGDAVLGRADGHLMWATYHRAVGDAERAFVDAKRALLLASEPRRPLALLTAHRLLGELDTDAGRLGDAAIHFDAALALADACAAPYERARILLGLAVLRDACGDRAAALALLGDVRAICTPIGAALALARADTIAAMARTHPDHSIVPGSLTGREVEVLRYMAAGMTNREIATALSVSARTVERHIENLYRKIGAHGRANATAYAFRYSLM